MCACKDLKMIDVACSEDGKVSKTLTLQPLGEKGDWFLGLDVKEAANKENSMRLGVPLTGAELHTVKTLSEVSYLSVLVDMICSQYPCILFFLILDSPGLGLLTWHG